MKTQKLTQKTKNTPCRSKKASPCFIPWCFSPPSGTTTTLRTFRSSQMVSWSSPCRWRNNVGGCCRSPSPTCSSSQVRLQAFRDSPCLCSQPFFSASACCPCPGLNRCLRLKETCLALFYWKLPNSKRSERGQSHGPLHCVFQTPSGILSANHYAKPHVSRTSPTPTLNLQLHPFILFLTVPPHPGAGTGMGGEVGSAGAVQSHPDLAENFHPPLILPLAKLERRPLHADPREPYAASIYSDINCAQRRRNKRALGGDCFKEAKNQGSWKGFFFFFFCSWGSETFG